MAGRFSALVASEILVVVSVKEFHGATLADCIVINRGGKYDFSGSPGFTASACTYGNITPGNLLTLVVDDCEVNLRSLVVHRSVEVGDCFTLKVGNCLRYYVVLYRVG